MLSINMRVFKALLIAALLYDIAECVPVKQKPQTKGSTTTKAPIGSVSSFSNVDSASVESVNAGQAANVESANAAQPSNSQSAIVEMLKVPESNMTIDYFDQRQNGSENYRLHVDGFTFVLAPVEALLLGQAIGGDALKPTTDQPTAEHKPMITSKSNNRGGLNMANLLVPFLRRFRQT